MACEYCRSNMVFPIISQSNKYKYLAIGSDGIMCLLNDYTVTRKLAKANFCFYCGRDLRGDNNGDD